MTTTQPSARDLLAAAYSEPWGNHKGLPADEEWAAGILATPSGAHLAAIVDAAVAWRRSWDGDQRTFALRADVDLTDAIDAAGAPR